jgi:transposase
MQYVGIDWAYRRAAWCAMEADGAVAGEGFVPADEDGLARLVVELGAEVRACLEMMSGAVWVRDRLAGAGWRVEVADARKVKNVAPLACKTDRVDARVLAELCRRDLVPALWIPSLEERALREWPKRRLHLVRLRTSANNRVLRPAHPVGAADPAPAPPPGQWPRAARGRRRARAPAPLGGRSARADRSTRRADRSARSGAWAAGPRRPALLAVSAIPGIGPVLGLTIAAEIGDIVRFSSAHKLVGYAGLAPRVKQSGERSRSGELSKAGSRTLRFAAVEAAQGAWRETNRWHRLYSDVKARTGKANPQSRRSPAKS